MAKLSIRNKKSLRDIVNSDENFEIYKNPKTGKVVVNYNDTPAGIDSRLEPICMEFATTGDLSVLKTLAESSFMCEAQELGQDGNPAITGIDPKTGQPEVAKWIPCLLMSGGGANTLVTKQNIKDALNA